MTQPGSYNLRPLKRFITGLNEKGEAVFLPNVDDNLPIRPLEQLPLENTKEVAKVALGYVTTDFPVQLDDYKDLVSYEDILANGLKDIALRNGIVFRILEFPPAATSPMHYTQSIDFGVVLEGSVIAGLDSGETRVMRRGDSCIQRATNHDWKNASQTEWARMLFVLCDAEGGLPKDTQPSGH